MDKKSAIAVAQDFDRERIKYGDEIMANLSDIHKIAGKPRITSNDRFNTHSKYSNGSPRPYWVSGVNRIHNVSNIEDIISELAHPLQNKFGHNSYISNVINSLLNFKLYNADKGVKGISWYDNPKGIEYETHNVFEPMIQEAIYYKTPPS